ncbi:MAG: glycosyl hydrolase [Clostridiales bacterium]|nr:glycosyl hydrolase [Clostridiales bacterium]
MDIRKVISQMTLEEKCSLLSGSDFWHTKAVERLGIPAVMVSDGPHGLRKQDTSGDHLGINDSIKAVCFPAGCASTASFDRELVYEVGEDIGDSCQHEELAVNLGPAINIKRSPLCGRNFEYLSEDPYLAGEMAASLVRGVQSRNVGVSVKHYLANNQEHRRMSSSSNIDERTLREIYLAPFEKVVKDAKPWTVMCSYNRINGVLASENKRYLTDILRGEWGFDGYVMSDWGAVSDRVKGVEAGLDLEMPSSGGVNDRRVLEAVRSGKLDEKYVDLAVERILTVSERYLMNAKPDTVWDKEAQHEAARVAAGKSAVLLKNDDGILPVRKGQKLAVIGQFARTPRFQGGGSSHINCFRVTSLWDEWKDRGDVIWADGYDLKTEEPDEALLAEAEKAAAGADVVIIMAGLPDSFESEGYDRTHMRMPRNQEVLISRVAKVNPAAVVVLHNGSPVEMPWIGEVKGVLEMYLGGQAVGGATADLLTGAVNPSGRLPESFPLRLEDTPCYLNYGGEGNQVNYTEGVFVGYRYYDKKKMDVLFPFGYGLSYTSFAYSGLTADREKMKDTETLTVTVDVQNTGKVPGAEVVQLYVADPESSVFRPVRELKGFDKVYLQPGEKKTVTFTLDKRAFAYWNTDIDNWYVESGDFLIQIGTSSRDIVLEKKVCVESTDKVPQKFDINSIMLDILKSEKAMQVMAPILQQMKEGMFGGQDPESADSAVTDDMAQAMIKYMPLHGLLTFGGGQITWEMLEQMCQAMSD